MHLVRIAIPILIVALALLVGGPAHAVQVDLPAGPLQPKSGCGCAAEFNDLRIYQVMVESFVNGNPAINYGAGYGTSHHGGDLKGITQSLDYIKGLGTNAIWLTPVFDSQAGTPQQRLGGGSVTNLKLDATGYYTRNYFQIDPKFGTLADAQELVNAAHARGMYVLFDGVFGHHKGGLVASPTGKLPVNSTDPADYGGNPAGYPGRVVDYDFPATVEFYKEVATYWVNTLGIDGWRLDQAYQVPPSAWSQIRQAVEGAAAQRAAAGQQWGTLGYMVAEVWSGYEFISDAAFGSDANPVLHSAFDFPVRYATMQVLAGEESGLSGMPASELADSWSYGAHSDYPAHALPNLMLGNHDLVRYGDLLQRAGIAGPTSVEYWTRHRLAFMVQGAYSGPITRYYGEEIGDEVPNYANQVTNNCANLGLCDDHVARTSAKIEGVTVTSAQLSPNQHALLDFHRDVMAVREMYPALSHGDRQHLYSDDELYVDLKTYGDQQVLFAMNISDQSMELRLNESLFQGDPLGAWDLLSHERFGRNGQHLSFTLAPLSARYLLVVGPATFAADFDDDGDVDGDDLGDWIDAFASSSGGDANGDQVSAGDDFLAWQQQFGDGLASAIPAWAPVPEPAGQLFVAALAALLVGRRARFQTGC